MSTYERLVNSQNFFSPYLTQEDLSRLGRNTIDTGYYIEQYFRIRSIRFIAVNENFDTANPEDAHSGIIIPLRNMINEAVSVKPSPAKTNRQAPTSLPVCLIIIIVFFGKIVSVKPPHNLRSNAVA